MDIPGRAKFVLNDAQLGHGQANLSTARSEQLVFCALVA
jgi:hypothetical protein